MQGRTVIVTGSSSGIGLVTACELARMGARVVMICRPGPHVDDARRRVEAAAGTPSRVELLSADLSSLASVRAVAAEFLRTHDRLHVLVNNAGLYLPERRVTADGFEATFATNHLGPFLLTRLLLDVLRASAPSRIICVASEAHRMGRIAFDDLQGQETFRGMRAYAQSKLANILFVRELARRLAGTGVTANSLHPGVVRTGFGHDAGGFMNWGTRLVSRFMITPEVGARTSIHLASSPLVENVTGLYFARCKTRTPAAAARDDATARRLWDVSERLVGLAP